MTSTSQDIAQTTFPALAIMTILCVPIVQHRQTYGVGGIQDRSTNKDQSTNQVWSWYDNYFSRYCTDNISFVIEQQYTPQFLLNEFELLKQIHK